MVLEEHHRDWLPWRSRIGAAVGIFRVRLRCLLGGGQPRNSKTPHKLGVLQVRVKMNRISNKMCLRIILLMY